MAAIRGISPALLTNVTSHSHTEKVTALSVVQEALLVLLSFPDTMYVRLLPSATFNTLT